MNKNRSILNWNNLRRNMADYKSMFSNGEPFRYVAMNDFINEDARSEIEDGFKKVFIDEFDYSKRSHRDVYRKAGIRNLLSMTSSQCQFFNEINSPDFIEYLSYLTEISPIFGDTELRGGGLHNSIRGGYLNIHTDFNFHPVHGTHRRLNLILYLNKEWRPEWGGGLELWNADVTERKVNLLPRANMAVLFETSEISFHGHPTPLNCPEGVSRKTLAVYYYSHWPNGLHQRAKTNYILTPTQLADLKVEIAAAIANGARTFEEACSLIENFQPSHVKRAFYSVMESMKLT